MLSRFCSVFRIFENHTIIRNSRVNSFTKLEENISETLWLSDAEQNTTAHLLVILVPVQPLLVELDNHLGNLDVGLLGWHQVCLI